VFNTSMTGYQEVLTDPSYAGQIVTMTAPHIGNYGVSAGDAESQTPRVAGFVMREASPLASNWRADGTLRDYLVRHHIVAIGDIDTRALTRVLRSAGVMRGVIATGQVDRDELVEKARAIPRMEGADLVNGYKIRRADALYRVVIGRLYHWTAKLLFGLKVRDVDCDFRLIRRSLIDRINLVSMKGSICCEMIKKLQMTGCRIVEVPVHHYPRVSGRSQFFTFSKVALSLAMLLRLWSDMVLAPALRPVLRRLPFPRSVRVSPRPPE
jgi:carbamoyl-phosphate synthase small subunit